MPPKMGNHLVEVPQHQKGLCTVFLLKVLDVEFPWGGRVKDATGKFNEAHVPEKCQGNLYPEGGIGAISKR